MVSLGGGLPSSEYFPFEELSIKVPELGRFRNCDDGPVLVSGKHDLLHGQSDFDIATAFNYGQGYGMYIAGLMVSY